MQNWYYSFILALAGSWHCILMCGPILSRINSSQTFHFSQVLYQIGRILIYTILGFLVAKFANIGLLKDYWYIYFIASGLLIFLLGKGIIEDKVFNFFYQNIGKKMQSFGKEKGRIRWLIFGMANGFLPCGMIAQGLGIALIQPSANLGALSMLAFGIGTLPALQLAVFGFNKAKIQEGKMGKYLRKLTYLIAIILVFQGSWGIAAKLSDKVKNHPLTPIICHQPI